MQADYTLYLVTDSTRQILGDANLVDVVDAAIRGGVTIVQYRDKENETRTMIETAKQLHAVTRRHGVPLLINDRIDVALAVGCEGVHIGQDDMELQLARKLLGDKAIIGVTASSEQEAIAAAEAGADYLGLGTIFATSTKENTKSIIGTHGLKELLGALSKLERAVPTVCIGGINADTVQRVLFQGNHAAKSLDGVAVVSAIVAAEEPEKSAQTLRRLMVEAPPFARTAEVTVNTPGVAGVTDLIARVGPLVQLVAQRKPLCHNMTNTVVQNFAANVCLAVGGSPIMSSNGQEAPDLASLGGSLVLNMGTVTQEALDNYQMALKAYNAAGNAVLFDPVGGGATSIRRSAIATLQAAGYFDIIKGNESEIRTVLGEGRVTQRGVDSASDASLTDHDRALIVQRLASRERSIVLMTGATDYLSDGSRSFAISNGHALLGDITGSGCTLGSTIAAMAAVERHDKLLAVLAGLLLYEIAAELAASSPSVRGTGSFVVALLDSLYAIRQQSLRGDFAWTDAAKVRQLQI